MPEPHVFGVWTSAVVEEADAAFTEIEEKNGRLVAVVGGHGGVEVEAHGELDGVVSLRSLGDFRIPHGWRAASLGRPRPSRGGAGPGRRTRSTGAAVQDGVDQWTQSVSQLATWIRYSPPPAGAKPVEPWFDDHADEDDDGGPETTH